MVQAQFVEPESIENVSGCDWSIRLNDNDDEEDFGDSDR